MTKRFIANAKEFNAKFIQESNTTPKPGYTFTPQAPFRDSLQKDIKEIDLLAKIRTVCSVIQVILVFSYTMMWIYIQLTGKL